MTLFVISLLLALTLSFLCSLVEATLLSLTPGQIADLERRAPRHGAVWRRFKEDVERPIAVILSINTAAHTVGASVAGAQFGHLYDDRWLGLFSGLFTFAMLQFTEILPKSMGVRFNRRLAVLFTWPLLILVRVLSPVIYVLRLLNRPFEGRRGEGGERPLAVDEITALAGTARIANQIDARQEKIIRGAARLSSLPAREVMIPAEQITFLSTSQTLPEAIVTAHMDPHTRFPICEDGQRDRVLGYVNFKEMVYRTRTNPNDPRLAGVIRPVYKAGPDTPCSELLRQFVDEHVHMALVQDAGGRTLGLVTLEDVVEELVGWVGDEFDRLPRGLQPLSGGLWMAGGGLPMAELEAKTGARLPDAAGSLSAWLLRRLGRIPVVNDEVMVEGWKFVIRRVRRHKIFEVAVCRGA